MPRNCTETLIQFLKVSLRLLGKKNQAGEGVPFLLDQIVVFNPDGSHSRTVVQKAMWNRFVRDNADAIKNLDETQAALDCLQEEGKLHTPTIVGEDGDEIPPSPEKEATFRYEGLEKLLIDYLWRHQDFDLAEQKLEGHVADFEAVWCSDEVTHIVTIPLWNFDADREEIVLESEFRIAPFSEEERTAIWNRSAKRRPRVSKRDFARVKYKLEGVYLTESPTHSRGSAFTREAQTAVLALRLLGSGQVGVSDHFDRIDPWLKSTNRGSGTFERFAPEQGGADVEYFLSDEDVDEFVGLYDELRQLETTGRLTNLRVCLTRFGMSYAREADEDQVLDLAIAFENTLLFGIQEELSYRLALRGALLLNDIRDAEETYRLLRALYKARSKIVHAGKNLRSIARDGQIGGVAREDFAEECRRCLADVIQVYVNRILDGEDVRGISDSLDDATVSRLRADQ